MWICFSLRSLLWVAVALALAAAVLPCRSVAHPQNPEPPSGESGQAGGAQGEPVIKVQAPSVVVDVIVTDKKGRPVPGLKAADFAVYENNRPQKIVTFVPPITPAAVPGMTDVGAVRRTAPTRRTRGARPRQRSLHHTGSGLRGPPARAYQARL